MVFPTIMPANSVSGGYEIDNSLRFNDNDSARLTRTPSSAGNRRTFTLSVWIKLTVSPAGDSNYERHIFSADDGTGGNNNFDYIAINGLNRIFVYGYTGSENQQVMTTQVLRDPSAWYHLVVAYDTTQSTAADRVKIYLNGSRVTDIQTGNYPSQNLQSKWNNNNAHRIGSYPDQDSQYFDGYMSEYHVIDGAAKAPSDFGEFDDNGVWIPKEYTGSYGTNGFYLEFKETGTSQNSSGIGADTSGNDHHWAVTNFAATDVTTDTPTNNFATFNSIQPSNGGVFAEGNLQATTGAAGSAIFSTIAVASGKWYAEFICTAKTASHFLIGVCEADNSTGLASFHEGANVSGVTAIGYGFTNNAGKVSYGNGVSDAYSGNAPDVGDVISVALDVDNGTVIWSTNNTGQGTYTRPTANVPYVFAIGDGQGSATILSKLISAQRVHFQVLKLLQEIQTQMVMVISFMLYLRATLHYALRI